MVDSSIQNKWLFNFIEEYKVDDFSIWNELANYRFKENYKILFKNNKPLIKISGNKEVIAKILGIQVNDSNQLMQDASNLELFKWYEFEYIPFENISNNESVMFYFENEITLDLIKIVNDELTEAIIFKDFTFNSTKIENTLVFNYDNFDFSFSNYIYYLTANVKETNTYELNFIINSISKNLSLKFLEISHSEKTSLKKANECRKAVYKEISDNINKLWLQNNIEAINLIAQIINPTNKLFENIEVYIEKLDFNQIEREIEEWVEKITKIY